MTDSTDILGFFGVTKPLFVMTGLAGEDINRFVDREEQLEYMISSIRMGQRCAVIGAQGTGKSSFLLKLEEMMKKDLYCQYLQFSFPREESEKSRLYFLRKILRTLLVLISQNPPLLNLYEPGEIKRQTDLLDYSIIIEDHLQTRKSVEGDLEAGIKTDKILSLIIPAEVRADLNVKGEHEKGKVEKKDYPLHNENTLYGTIMKLLEKIDKPIVLFIDELDKVGRYPLESPEWDKEVMRILELSREIMSTEKLILVFALQQELYEKLRNAQRDEGDASILGLINAFKKLAGFDLEFAGKAVEASLRYAGYKGETRDLLETGVMEIALKKAAGNPRLFMHYLLESLKKAFSKRQKKITLEILKEFLVEIDEKLDEKRWQELVGPFIVSGT